VPEVDPAILVLLVGVGFMFHILLLALAKKVNPVATLGAAFMLLAAFSVADEFPGYELLKYARIYVTVLIVVVGFMFYRAYSYGIASLALLAFIGFYVAAAAWGPSPVRGIVIKGLTFQTVLAGITMALAFRTTVNLRNAARMLALTTAIFAALAFGELIRNPGAITAIGRYSPWGMNPNRFGQTAASMTILATFVMFNDRNFLWRLISLGSVGTLAFLMLLAGARGAIGMAAVGAFAVAFPMLKRPWVVAFFGGLGGGLILLFLRLVQGATPTRLNEANLDTREEPWADAINHFRDSPLVGKGWIASESVREGGSTVNLHSIYMQMLAETGLVGVALTVLAMLTLAFAGLRLWKIELREGGMKLRATYLAGALVAAVFAHGFVESASLAGSTVSAMLMGFGAGLIDRLPKLVDDLPLRGRARQQALEYSEFDDDDEYSEAGAEDGIEPYDEHDSYDEHENG